MSKQTIRFYEFDSFRIDVQNRALIRRGKTVRITPKTFDLLLVLIENRDREVGKDELLEKLWSPDANPNNVDQHIKKLRNILGGIVGLKSVQRSRYIKTFRSQGFKFQMAVTEVLDEPLEQPEAVSTALPTTDVSEESAQVMVDGENSSSPPRGKKMVRSMAVVGGILLLILGVFIWNWQRKSNASKTTRQEVRSPVDEEAVQRVIRESQFLETLTFYVHPEQFDRELLKKYWLPIEHGGKAITSVENAVKGLLTRNRHYGSESKNERFEISYVRIYSPRDYAEVGTIETWYVPTYNADGSRVFERNVRLGPYTVDYSLQKLNGVWLLEENSTPRPSSPAPSVTPTQR